VTIGRTLDSDPIEEARRQWVSHGWAEAADGMAAVTSIVRAQQIVLQRIDTVLRPLDLTFARYEILTLLSFTKHGSLPMTRMGALLQVHPTSVTSAVDRLEGQGFVERLPHPTDRRAVLASITAARDHRAPDQPAPHGAARAACQRRRLLASASPLRARPSNGAPVGCACHITRQSTRLITQGNTQ
jgi:DNA-binding MarR family transcriptional regulator